MLVFFVLMGCTDDRVQIVQDMLEADPVEQRAAYLCQADREAATEERLAGLGSADVRRFMVEPTASTGEVVILAIAEDGSGQRFTMRNREQGWCVFTGWAKADREREDQRIARQAALERAYQVTMGEFIPAVLNGSSSAQGLREELGRIWGELEPPARRGVSDLYGPYEQLEDYVEHSREVRKERERRWATPRRSSAQCKTGQPCGASCISWNKVCHK